MSLFLELSHFRGTNWEMDLGVGGPSCTGSAAAESPDIGAIVLDFPIFALLFKSEFSEGMWDRKTAQNFALFDLCEK